MSPSNINSFVGDLVQMAKAMETLPQVEQELEESRKLHRETLDIVARTQADLEQSRNYAASLEQKVRSLEVERDDASFRVLEAEDQAGMVLVEAKSMRSTLEIIISRLDPPKPQSEEVIATSEAMTQVPQAQPVKEPEASPLPVSEITDVTASNGVVSRENANSLGGIPDWMQDLLPSGQSESSPTVSSQTEEKTGSAIGSVTQEVSASSVNSEPTHGPYFNKRYMDVEGYISRLDWLAGDGTEYDYDWRPSTAQNCAF